MAENDSGDTTESPVEGISAIQWSDHVSDLTSFDNDSNLPAVVRYEDRMAKAGVPGGSLPPGIRLYANQPVLFHKRSSKRHVKARTIYHDYKGPYYEVGQTLIIPEEFDGWFEMVPPDFGRSPYCRTIGQIAEIMPRKFFTRSNLRAIRVVDEANNGDTENGDDGGKADEKSQGFKERRIPAGSILCIVGTFAGKWQTTAQAGLIKRTKKEWVTTEVTFLKCKDLDDMEVLIPFTTKGRFNVIYETGIKDSRTVYRIKDIIRDFQIPLKVRMVYGKAPVVPCIFTGMLVLKEEVKEDTIIASTISYKRNALFEVPASAKCDVKVAANEDDYSNLRTFIDAQNLCRKYAHAYSTLIKLSPELDTDQQPIQHIPTERRKDRDESLKTLDLITNISLTDDEPRSHFMDSSDPDSLQSDSDIFGAGQMMELKEINLPRNSQYISNA